MSKMQYRANDGKWWDWPDGYPEPWQHLRSMEVREKPEPPPLPDELFVSAQAFEADGIRAAHSKRESVTGEAVRYVRAGAVLETAALQWRTPARGDVWRDCENPYQYRLKP